MKAAPFNHPPCLCGEPVVQRPTEKPADWRTRKSCGKKECYRELLALRGTKNRARLAEHPGCIVCPDPVARRPNERRSEWFERKTCSPGCLTKLRAKQMTDRNVQWGRPLRSVALEHDHPHCAAPGCKRPIEIREGEPVHHWHKRKTCSPACHDRLRRLPHKAPTPPQLTAYRPPDTHPMRTFRRARMVWSAAGASFETVEEALARGVEITEIKFPPPAPGGIPVRAKASRFSKGRV